MIYMETTNIYWIDTRGKGSIHVTMMMLIVKGFGFEHARPIFVRGGHVDIGDMIMIRDREI